MFAIEIYGSLPYKSMDVCPIHLHGWISYKSIDKFN